jgi:hypothetical protein
MDLASFHPEMNRHLTQGFGVQLQLCLLGTTLEHPAQAPFHLKHWR